MSRRTSPWRPGAGNAARRACSRGSRRTPNPGVRTSVEGNSVLVYSYIANRRRIFLGLIRFVPLQFSTFGDLPLQFNYLESCHYNSRIHSPRPFCTPRAPLDPLAGDGICVLPSLLLADVHTGPTRAPTPRRTHSRLSFPSRLAAPNPRSPTAGGEDDGGRRRPGSAEATARIQERAARLLGSWNPRFLGTQ